MAFHDIRFPTEVSYGSSGGPLRRTEIVTLASGHEERNSPWAHSRRRYDAGMGLRSMDDIAAVTAFFEARGGQLHGFRWKDWADFKSCLPSQAPGPLDQVIGTGDGSTKVFSLVKAYPSGGETYLRPITRAVAATLRVAVGGTVLTAAQFTLGTGGQVTLSVAPAGGKVVTAGFEFDVPVRFDTDALSVSAATFRAGQIPSIPVIEVRD